MSGKTAMVLGTNAGQADLIRYLKKTGWHVIGCAGTAGESGAALCDVFELVDIRDVDALEQLARRHEIDLVYSISSDLAMKSVVALAIRMDLPRYHDMAFIDLLDNKAALRAFLDKHALSPVPFIEVESASETSNWTVFPCVVKPCDGQGQRGVQLIEDINGLNEAVDLALDISPTNRAIVEQFLDGVEMSCNVYVNEGRAAVRVLSERLVHKDLGIGIAKGHLVPAKAVSPADQAAAIELVEQTVLALGQTRGVLYFQMIQTADGPRIVEIAPRLDGCHMWRAIKAAHDIDFVELAVEGLVGDGEVPTLKPQGADVALMFQQAPPGRFIQADFPKPQGAIHHEYRYHDGDEIRPVNGKLEVVGYYVAEA